MHHAVKVRRAHHDPTRNDPVVEHLAVAVHVGQKRLQGTHPLGDPGLDHGPLIGHQNARHDVERERTLLAADVEGDALVEIGALEIVGAAAYLVGLELAHLPQRR